MTSRLLATTKFSVPELPTRYVPRPRLDEVLDSATELPLTIVVGVPGAGKSVVLRSWLQSHADLHSIWIACDARDGDPATFWLAVDTALSTAWPDRWPEDVIEHLEDIDPDFDDMAIATVNGLAQLGEPVVLVIDDFQFASKAAPSLLTLIEHLPLGCRVVVGSRTEPQLGLHRFRAYGQVLEIRDPELRLTPAEVPALMHEYGVDLTESELELVVERTEGWMAGVQMAAVSLCDGSDPDRFLADLAKTESAVIDFLGTEVLDRLDFETREFLQASSVLDVLDWESCAAVTQRSDVDERLRQLAERNLFVIDLGGGLYRYHHLFGDLLKHRLRREDGHRVVDLHRRAATYFSRIGDSVRAIDHLLAVDDVDGAFAELRSNLVAGFHREDGRMPRRVVTKLEAHLGKIECRRIPDVALALAAGGTPGEASPWIRRANKRWSDFSDADRGRLALAQALLALQYGDAVEMEHALSGYSGPNDFVDDELAEFVPGLIARSRLWCGDVDGARQLCEAGEGSFSNVSLTSQLAWVACVEGGLTEAKQLADQALAGAESVGLVGHPVMVEAFCAHGRVAFERADLTSAECLFEASLSISESVRPALALMSQLLLSRVWLANGRGDEALEGVLRARGFLPADSTSPLLQFCHALEGRIAIALGELDRAEHCARVMDSGYAALGLQTRINIAAGEFDRANGTLGQCAPTTIRQRIDVAVLEARIAYGRKSEEADDALTKAMDLARTEGFILAVADDLAQVRSRVALLLRSRPIGSHDQAVLDRLEADLTLVKRSGRDAGPLSDRELTVVRYLASRLTMKEIAADIYVSSNTLKTHVRRIYGKFGVSSRSEAVAECRRLGLL